MCQEEAAGLPVRFMFNQQYWYFPSSAAGAGGGWVQIQIEEVAVIADQLCPSSRLRLTLEESSAQRQLPANAPHTDFNQILIFSQVFNSFPTPSPSAADIICKHPILNISYDKHLLKIYFGKKFTARLNVTIYLESESGVRRKRGRG